jgi:hypothetical protein
MSNAVVAVWTFVWIILFVVIYRYVFNPQIVITPSVEKLKGCPDRWTFNGKLCEPDYTTSCRPFDPKTITTLSQACNICKSCGTNWSNMCLT